jgi:glucose/arabinose dehydrogenase
MKTAIRWLLITTMLGGCATPSPPPAAPAAPPVQPPPAASPAWQQGRPAAMAQSPLAPFATPAAPTPGDRIPLQQLRVPPGFRIELWASGIHNARSLALGSRGTVFVGSRVAGKVYAVRDQGDRREVITLASGLQQPNGIAFRSGALYVVETSRVLRFDDIEARLNSSPTPVVVFDQLPKEAHHHWRYAAFGPDGALYVAIGAPCNICEPSSQHAQIRRIDLASGTGEVIARGVRNSVGFDWHPTTRELWFTDNGRDWAEADRVPDELNRVAKSGQHFGFPYCHGGDFVDPEFGKGRACGEYVPPALKLGPNVAALGMRFYTGAMFPPEYRSNLFLALRGSWNRERKTGFAVMRAVLDGDRVVRYEPFVTGWINDERFWGRPVDVLVLPDGALLVSDDHAGALFRVSVAR